MGAATTHVEVRRRAAAAPQGVRDTTVKVSFKGGKNEIFSYFPADNDSIDAISFRVRNMVDRKNKVLTPKNNYRQIVTILRSLFSLPIKDFQS